MENENQNDRQPKAVGLETVVSVSEAIAGGQLLTEKEFIEQELQKHYDKQLTMPFIVGLINNIAEYYPADVYVSSEGKMARHILKLLKQELILACNIEDSRREH